MLKKRIIFTLLFNDGQFALSRNFRLQQVGNLDWLQRNYNFASVAFFIDELVVLDVSRGKRDEVAFRQALSQISAGCFAPIAAGGGIRSVAQAKALLRAGADKVILNTSLFENPRLVSEIAAEFGQQCIVGSVDVRQRETGYDIVTHNGSRTLDIPADEAFAWHTDGTVGELYLNSIDQDGTGQGYDFHTLDLLPKSWALPVIMAGGVGNEKHLSQGLKHDQVDAVATAHLFNFVGDGLQKARNALAAENLKLAEWCDLTKLDLYRKVSSSARSQSYNLDD